jgi:hypothetical protein
MKDITYKYNVGDYVKFKSKFSSPTCGLVGREGTIAKITGHAFAYNNRPHYYINDIEGEVFTETCFAGLATESEFLAQSSLVNEPTTNTQNETKCDTEDSGAPENLWEVISELSDIRASFSAFNEEERAKYHALSVAINKLREELIK